MNIIIIQKHIRGYLTRKNILIPSSFYQTKIWRKNQKWYKGGKFNECETYQKNIIEIIIKSKLNKTNERINMENNEIVNKLHPMKEINGYEYTENFDGKFIKNNNIYYFNLKFICDAGGSQTRSLREVYHFIKNQINFLIKFDTKNIYFINILDGNTCFNNIEKFKYLVKNNTIRKYVFNGNLNEFQKYFN